MRENWAFSKQMPTGNMSVLIWFIRLEYIEFYLFILSFQVLETRRLAVAHSRPPAVLYSCAIILCWKVPGDRTPGSMSFQDLAGLSPGERVPGVVHDTVKVIDFSQRVHLPGLHLQKVVLLSCEWRRTSQDKTQQFKAHLCQRWICAPTPWNTQFMRNPAAAGCHMTCCCFSISVHFMHWQNLESLYHFHTNLAECCPG